MQNQFEPKAYWESGEYRSAYALNHNQDNPSLDQVSTARRPQSHHSSSTPGLRQIQLVNLYASTALI